MQTISNLISSSLQNFSWTFLHTCNQTLTKKSKKLFRFRCIIMARLQGTSCGCRTPRMTITSYIVKHMDTAYAGTFPINCFLRSLIV